MSIAAFRPSGSQVSSAFPSQFALSATNMAHDAFADRRMSSANEGLYAPTTLLLRKLPKTTTSEDVRTMLLFAKDLQDTEIVPNEYDEDKGFITAVARFSTMVSASEAQAMLDGKPNTAKQAAMIVEIIPSSNFAPGFRRNTIDPSIARGVPKTVSPPIKSSRFNGTFQSIEKLSPPHMGSPPENPSSDASSHLQTIFAPQSPVSNIIKDRSRVSGKSMIGEDGGDEETDGLLQDTLAYIRTDKSGMTPMGRKSNHPRMPVASFNALSLNTSLNGPSPPSYTSPRSSLPHTPFSPGGSSYHVSGNQYLRHNYPPVNPADQNPPCNTLYVGNLPMDTSEDELKAMFSKQRGYKRLCFRTKQNGPMCFVEFEDVSFATKALNELYGAQLHNSVKGGIRLSFSKNPLGVRSGQPGSNTNPSTPLTATGSSMSNGLNVMSPGGFTTANGPPPGLSVPPGFSVNHSVGSPIMNTSQFANQNLGPGGASAQGMRGIPPSSNSGPPSMYPDYMMGR